jgi:hypothetical protein
MRRQDRKRSRKPPQHGFPSFVRYLNKVFDFRSRTDALTDSRHQPDISPAAVFRAVFHGFVFRLGSFQQLESEIAEPAFQRWMGANRAFRDDVLRFSLCGFDLSALQAMLVQVNRTLKRNKALDAGRVQGRIVAALDGVEVLSSYSRCCDSCLQRVIKFPQSDGRIEERTQYYHQAVGCQIVSSPLKPILALEWRQPGEGEDVCARRLLTRLVELYGSRFFDILLLDSLYPQAPLLRLTQQVGWDVVISLKQQRRDLYQDAMGLFQNRGPDLEFEQQERDCHRQVQLWHAADLPFSEDYPLPMQVVLCQEQVKRQRVRGGQPYTENTPQQWCWISTLEASSVPARVVWHLGHLRWKNENNGWNDLSQNFALKHGFLHACKHRPTTLSAEGKREPVANHGLAVVALIRCLAFNLFSAFVRLHSKLFRRYSLGVAELARQLRRSFWKSPPSIRSPVPSRACA